MTDQNADVLSAYAADKGPQLVNRDKEMIPRVLLRAMLILALSALALTTYAVATDRPLVGTPAQAPVVAERSVILDGNVSGAVKVTDARTGEVIVDLGDDEGGFIQVIWRANARTRMLHDAAPLAPLTLQSFENGRIAISDPETGWTVELGSFGGENKESFAALLR